MRVLCWVKQSTLAEVQNRHPRSVRSWRVGLKVGINQCNGYLSTLPPTFPTCLSHSQYLQFYRWYVIFLRVIERKHTLSATHWSRSGPSLEREDSTRRLLYRKREGSEISLFTYVCVGICTFIRSPPLLYHFHLRKSIASLCPRQSSTASWQPLTFSCTCGPAA